MKQLFFLLWMFISIEAFGQIKLVQNTAVDVGVGPFVDPTDGTAETALTLSQADVRLKKNGGSWAQKTQASSCSHEENGWYECSLDATDTNTTGILILAVNESGALPVWIYFEVIPQASYDPLVAGDVANVSDIFAEPVPGSYTAGQAGYVIGHNTRYIAAGTSDSGTTTTVVDAERIEADTDYFKGALIVFTSGTLAGQSREITAFTPASDTITYSPATTQAAGTHSYEIWPAGGWIRPTTAGRTLDVTATGEAGLDLDNTAGTIDAAEAPNLDAAVSTRASQTSVDTIDDFLDTEVAAIKTKTDFLPSVTAGAAGGVFIAGTNAATTVTTAFTTTFTGNLTGSVGSVATGLVTFQKNVTYSNFTFRMVDDTDGKTPEPGLTVSCQVSKDGGSPASCTNSVSEISGGVGGLYKTNLAAADLNADEVYLTFTASGARRLDFKIRPQK